MKPSFIDFSKTLAYLLRHHPEEFGATLDDEGWTSLEGVSTGLSTHFDHPVTVDELRSHVAKQTGKKRFELRGEEIRAVHGHSVSLEKPTGTQLTPPAVLFHGTVDRFLPSILEQGLLPQNRQFVHLSDGVAMAKDVGTRRSGDFVLLSIAAAAAYEDGAIFYQTTSMVWLTKRVAPEFISVEKI